MRYGDGTDFLIDNSGSRVWCRWPPQFSFDYAATYLYGPILGFLLRLRGVVCLHASVAVIAGWAVGFMGPQRAGKSTLAAALAERRFSVLSDDILALAESDGMFEALPAYPRLRLWPESVTALFGTPDALPRITPSWEKRHLALAADRFDTQRRPLGAIYFLEQRSNDCPNQRIAALTGAKGLNLLIANTYAFKIFDKPMRAHEFSLLSRLAGQVPFRSVVPFADLIHIERLCKLVLDDFGALPRPGGIADRGSDFHV